MTPLITLIVPCYKRPQRTLRALESIIKQDLNGWEAIFIGDNCPDFQKFIDDGIFHRYSRDEKLEGNSLTFINLEEHHGGWGSYCRGEGIKLAKGKFICFLDNDDIILNNHLSNYSSFMEANPEVDIAYFNARTEPWKKDRISTLSRGGIGNAELCLKSLVLKLEYDVDNQYEHDWRLVDKLMKKKYNIKKCN